MIIQKHNTVLKLSFFMFNKFHKTVVDKFLKRYKKKTADLPYNIKNISKIAVIALNILPLESNLDVLRK